MKINVLQSLIDRTSNQIAEYEACVAHEKAELAGWCAVDWEREQHKYCLQYYNNRLPKLREIQKALKKEIADKLKWQSFRLHYAKQSAYRRNALSGKWAVEELKELKEKL